MVCYCYDSHSMDGKRGLRQRLNSVPQARRGPVLSGICCSLYMTLYILLVVLILRCIVRNNNGRWANPKVMGLE